MGWVVALASWEIVAFATEASGLVPHFPAVWRELLGLFEGRGIEIDCAWTLRRMLLGFGLALSVGLPAGILLGAIPALNELFGGWVSFFRSIPAFVVLPILLAVMNGGEAARVGMITFGCFFVLVAYVAMGTRGASRLRIDVARTYHAPRAYVFFQVILRDALPQILDGARISLSLALILAMVSEIMLGASHGLGTRVNDSLAGFDLPKMYALILVVGLLGSMINLIGSVVCLRLVPYADSR